MPSLLNVYVLSLLDRGIGTPYALQRQGGLSLGASTPSLRRLTEAGLIKRKEEQGMTNRPRHVYTLTPSGRGLARSGWRAYFESGRLPPDLDSVLRLCDIASHYGATHADVARFLKNASQRRATLARRSVPMPDEDCDVMYLPMRARCDAARLKAEADVLGEMAAEMAANRLHSRVSDTKREAQIPLRTRRNK